MIRAVPIDETDGIIEYTVRNATEIDEIINSGIYDLLIEPHENSPVYKCNYKYEWDTFKTMNGNQFLNFLDNNYVCGIEYLKTGLTHVDVLEPRWNQYELDLFEEINLNRKENIVLPDLVTPIPILASGETFFHIANRGLLYYLLDHTVDPHAVLNGIDFNRSVHEIIMMLNVLNKSELAGQLEKFHLVDFYNIINSMLPMKHTHDNFYKIRFDPKKATRFYPSGWPGHYISVGFCLNKKKDKNGKNRYNFIIINGGEDLEYMSESYEGRKDFDNCIAIFYPLKESYCHKIVDILNKTASICQKFGHGKKLFMMYLMDKIKQLYKQNPTSLKKRFVQLKMQTAGSCSFTNKMYIWHYLNRNQLTNFLKIEEESIKPFFAKKLFMSIIEGIDKNKYIKIPYSFTYPIWSSVVQMLHKKYKIDISDFQSIFHKKLSVHTIEPYVGTLERIHNSKYYAYNKPQQCELSIKNIKSYIELGKDINIHTELSAIETRVSNTRHYSDYAKRNKISQIVRDQHKSLLSFGDYLIGMILKNQKDTAIADRLKTIYDGYVGFPWIGKTYSTDHILSSKNTLFNDWISHSIFVPLMLYMHINFFDTSKIQSFINDKTYMQYNDTMNESLRRDFGKYIMITTGAQKELAKIVDSMLRGTSGKNKCYFFWRGYMGPAFSSSNIDYFVRRTISFDQAIYNTSYVNTDDLIHDAIYIHDVLFDNNTLSQSITFFNLHDENNIPRERSYAHLGSTIRSKILSPNINNITKNYLVIIAKYLLNIYSDPKEDNKLLREIINTADLNNHFNIIYDIVKNMTTKSNDRNYRNGIYMLLLSLFISIDNIFVDEIFNKDTCHTEIDSVQFTIRSAGADYTYMGKSVNLMRESNGGIECSYHTIGNNKRMSNPYTMDIITSKNIVNNDQVIIRKIYMDDDVSGKELSTNDIDIDHPIADMVSRILMFNEGYMIYIVEHETTFNINLVGYGVCIKLIKSSNIFSLEYGGEEYTILPNNQDTYGVPNFFYVESTTGKKFILCLSLNTKMYITNQIFNTRLPESDTGRYTARVFKLMYSADILSFADENSWHDFIFSCLIWNNYNYIIRNTEHFINLVTEYGYTDAQINAVDNPYGEIVRAIMKKTGNLNSGYDGCIDPISIQVGNQKRELTATYQIDIPLDKMFSIMNEGNYGDKSLYIILDGDSADIYYDISGNKIKMAKIAENRSYNDDVPTKYKTMDFPKKIIYDGDQLSKVRAMLKPNELNDNQILAIGKFAQIKGTIRPGNLEMAIKFYKYLIDANKKNLLAVHELLMGSGKSKFITPMIIILLAYHSEPKISTKNIVICVPNTLKKQTYNIMLHIGSVIGKCVCLIDEKNFESLHFRTNMVVIMDDAVFKHIHLKCNEPTMNRNRISKYNLDLKDSFIIFDEIDHIANPLTCELNIERDNHAEIGEYDVLIEMISMCYDLLNPTNGDLWDRESLAGKYMKINGANFLLDNSVLNVIREYIKTKTGHLKYESKECPLYLYFNELIIPFLLSNTYNVNYGLPATYPDSIENKQYMLKVIPYSAVDTPVYGSQYSNIILSITLSYFIYKRTGLVRKIDKKFLIDHIRKNIIARNFSAQEINSIEATFNKYKIGEYNVRMKLFDPSFCVWDKMDTIILDDSSNHEVFTLKYYMNNIIKESVGKYRPSILNVSMTELLLSDNYTNYVSFTGTPYVHLPTNIPGKLEFNYAEKINRGSIIDKLGNPVSIDLAICVAISKMKTVHLLSDVISVIVNSIERKDSEERKDSDPDPYNTLIDVGAFFINEGIKKIIENLAKDKKFSSYYSFVIYSDEENKYYDVKGDKHYSLESFDISSEGRRFFIFDNSHITGVDFEEYMPDNSIALTTIASNTRLRDLSQGIFRLRKIFKGDQYTDYIVSKEIESSIMAAVCPKTPVGCVNITSDNRDKLHRKIYELVCSNEIKYNSQQKRVVLKQNIIGLARITLKHMFDVETENRRHSSYRDDIYDDETENRNHSSYQDDIYDDDDLLSDEEGYVIEEIFDFLPDEEDYVMEPTFDYKLYKENDHIKNFVGINTITKSSKGTIYKLSGWKDPADLSCGKGTNYSIGSENYVDLHHIWSTNSLCKFLNDGYSKTKTDSVYATTVQSECTSETQEESYFSGFHGSQLEYVPFKARINIAESFSQIIDYIGNTKCKDFPGCYELNSNEYLLCSTDHYVKDISKFKFFFSFEHSRHDRTIIPIIAISPQEEVIIYEGLYDENKYEKNNGVIISSSGEIVANRKFDTKHYDTINIVFQKNGAKTKIKTG